MTFDNMQQKVEPQYGQPPSYDYIPQNSNSNFSQPSPYSQPLNPQQEYYTSYPQQQQPPSTYTTSTTSTTQQNFYGAPAAAPYYAVNPAPVVTTTVVQTASAPQSLDIAYWNGRFSYEFANLPAYGCDPIRVQQTFTTVGKLVFSNFTLPYILVNIGYLIIELVLIFLFIGCVSLPWITMVWVTDGWYIGLIFSIGGVIVFIIVTIFLGVGVGVLQRNFRNKAQIIAQNYLQQEMTSYYSSLGISFQFYYFTFAVYTRRNVRFIYKPRIMVNFSPR